jgi:hypothetical protein
VENDPTWMQRLDLNRQACQECDIHYKKRGVYTTFKKQRYGKKQRCLLKRGILGSTSSEWTFSDVFHTYATLPFYRLVPSGSQPTIAPIPKLLWPRRSSVEGTEDIQLLVYLSLWPSRSSLLLVPARLRRHPGTVICLIPCGICVAVPRPDSCNPAEVNVS